MSATGHPTRLLKSYLLGRLDPETQRSVEERLFSDDRVFWERLCLEEDELIDEYVGGDLSEEDRVRFQSHFLCTEDRRDRLSFARALREHVETLTDSESHREKRIRPAGSVWDRVKASVTPRSRALAVAAALLAATVSLTWQLATSRDNDREVTAVLVPGLLRGLDGNLERIVLHAQSRLVRLHLDIGADEYESYRAALQNASGEELLMQARLRATRTEERQTVVLVVPSEILTEDDYVVRLLGVSAAGTVEPLHRYDFRVLRE